MVLDESKPPPKRHVETPVVYERGPGIKAPYYSNSLPHISAGWYCVIVGFSSAFTQVRYNSNPPVLCRDGLLLCGFRNDGNPM